MAEDASQAERREVLRNDTYLSRAKADADLAAGGGRFAKEVATRVVGVPRYPTLPATSPWAGDPVPDEPPLGYSIDEMPIVGEPHEVSPPTDRGVKQRSEENG